MPSKSQSKKRIPAGAAIYESMEQTKTAYGFYLLKKTFWILREDGKEERRGYISSRRQGKLIPKPEYAEEVARICAEAGPGKRRKRIPIEYFNLVPTDPKKDPLKNKRKKKDKPATATDEAAEKGGGEIVKIASEVKDVRNAERVKYPLWIVLMVIWMAAASGITTAVQIADYWRCERDRLSKIFGASFPKSNISHDTIRRVQILLAERDGGKTLKELFARVLKVFLGDRHPRLIGIDGQAARSSKTAKGLPHYTLSAVDLDLRITVCQDQVGEKTNEMTHADKLLDSLNLVGVTVTADALHARKSFVNKIFEKQGDFVICIKRASYSKELYDDIVRQAHRAIATNAARYRRVEVAGHGRTEVRDFYAIKGRTLKGFKDDWPGVQEGTFFMVRNKVTETKTGKESEMVRYFITSYDFDSFYVMDQGIRAIRNRWGIESLHWEIDLQMGEDFVQMSNNHYILSQRMLARIGMAFIRVMQTNYGREHGNKHIPSVESLMIEARNPQVLVDVLEDLQKKKSADEAAEEAVSAA